MSGTTCLKPVPRGLKLIWLGGEHKHTEIWTKNLSFLRNFLHCGFGGFGINFRGEWCVAPSHGLAISRWDGLNPVDDKIKTWFGPHCTLKSAVVAF
jgi:hypothetical protein